jgi:hypothetical protein
LLTKSKHIQEQTYRIISTYKTSVRRSYRILAKMPTEWPNMTELRSGGTLGILNNINDVAADVVTE